MDKEHIYATISCGELLSRARRAKGLIQDELGKLCNVTKTHISQLEHGRMAPSTHLAVLLAKHLDLDLQRFLRFLYRCDYGDEMADLIFGISKVPDQEYLISPELKYIFWTIENLPEEKRKQTIKAMEEILKLALA